MSIKINPADQWFSKCIRERANWTCEHCLTVYERGAQGLHCSHLFGRRAYAIRFCPDNAFAHCFGCHQKLGSNPVDFTLWATAKIGQGMIDILTEKKNDISLAKLHKKNTKEVAAHYKREYAVMLDKRADGHIGRIEFPAYL